MKKYQLLIKKLLGQSKKEETETVCSLIKRHEGFSKHLYEDTKGNLTIGYGTNLANGISREWASILLEAEVDRIHKALISESWYNCLSTARQSVIISMGYQMGLAGLFRFRNMIVALK